MAAEDYLRASMPWVGQGEIHVVFTVIEIIRLKVIVNFLRGARHPCQARARGQQPAHSTALTWVQAKVSGMLNKRLS